MSSDEMILARTGRIAAHACYRCSTGPYVPQQSFRDEVLVRDEVHLGIRRGVLACSALRYPNANLIADNVQL